MKLSRCNILLPITLAMLGATLNMQAFASEPIGGVTLLSKNNAPCGFTPPAEGSGQTYNYATNSPSYGCYPATVRSVRFDRLPSAMEVIFSSRPDCNTGAAEDKEYWIKFKTTATNTGSPNIYSFEELQTYSKGQTIFRGLKLVDKKEVSGEEVRDATTCVKFIASADIDTPAPGSSLVLKDEGTVLVKESDGTEAICPGSTIIFYRQHGGDENEATRYNCRLAENYDIRDRKWSVSFRESGLDPEEETNATPSANNKRYIYFTCPVNTVMTGRYHSGDENGSTKYQCASLVNSNNGRIVLVEPTKWTPEHEESSDTYETCPTNQIMIGRAHKNDENGETRYLCATLRPAAQ